MNTFYPSVFTDWLYVAGQKQTPPSPHPPGKSLLQMNTVVHTSWQGRFPWVIETGLAVPLPKASLFLCSLKSFNSFFSSPLRLLQYLTSLSWGGSWCRRALVLFFSPSLFTYGTLSSGREHMNWCTCKRNNQNTHGVVNILSHCSLVISYWTHY